MSSTSDVANSPEFQSFIKRSYGMTSSSDAQAVYSDWAKHYNAQILDSSVDYKSPALVSEAAVKYLPSFDSLQILDAGCGTGLAGVAFLAVLEKDSASSTKTIALDGCDLTPAMLDIAAETKAFRKLIQVDLNKPLSEAGITDSSYDVIICAGTLTEGHVGPQAISSFVRATRPHGIISATVLDRIWESGGFRDEVERLVQDGSAEVLVDGAHSYWKGTNARTRVLVLRKRGGA